MKLEVKKIRKRFEGKEVLKGVGFSVESGRALGLLGRNVPRYEQETGSLFRHLQLWRELYT